MGFKENLKCELSYQGMLVKELAALTGISKKTLDNYLNARGYKPSIDAAVKIAQALGVTVEYLVTGEDFSTSKSSLDPVILKLIQNFKRLNNDDRNLVIGFIELLKTRKNLQ